MECLLGSYQVRGPQGLCNSRAITLLPQWKPEMKENAKTLDCPDSSGACTFAELHCPRIYRQQTDNTEPLKLYQTALFYTSHDYS